MICIKELMTIIRLINKMSYKCQNYDIKSYKWGCKGLVYSLLPYYPKYLQLLPKTVFKSICLRTLYFLTLLLSLIINIIKTTVGVSLNHVGLGTFSAAS